MQYFPSEMQLPSEMPLRKSTFKTVLQNINFLPSTYLHFDFEGENVWTEIIWLQLLRCPILVYNESIFIVKILFKHKNINMLLLILFIWNTSDIFQIYWCGSKIEIKSMNNSATQIWQLWQFEKSKNFTFGKLKVNSIGNQGSTDSLQIHFSRQTIY